MTDHLVASQTQGQAKITTTRDSAKAGFSTNMVFRLLILATIVIMIMVAASAGGWNTYWLLLVGGAIVWAGGKLTKTKSVSKETLWIFPSITKGIGGVVMAYAILTSGLAKLAEYGVSRIDVGATCVVAPNGPECKRGKTPPTPGTWEVTDFEYLRIPDGESRQVELRDDKRLVLERTPGTCPAYYPKAGVIKKDLPSDWETHYLSEGGVRNVEIRILFPGMTWHDYFCQ